MNTVGVTDSTLQRIISITLRSGVIVASIVGIIGGLLYLSIHGNQPTSFHVFEGTPSTFSSPSRVIHDALKLPSDYQSERSLAIAQLGIMILLVTPIIRVAFSMIGFALERDRIYVLITCVVLVMLTASMLLH